MTVLHPSPVSVEMFTWDAKTSMFVAEMSDLGEDFRYGRVYDDACDAGITLYSRYPGKDPVVFAIDHTERDAEGDICYEDLKAVGPNAWKAGFKVRIYND